MLVMFRVTDGALYMSEAFDNEICLRHRAINIMQGSVEATCMLLSVAVTNIGFREYFCSNLEA